MEVKRSEEAKSGVDCDVWGEQDGLDDAFIPLGVTDELIKQKFGTTFNKRAPRASLASHAWRNTATDDRLWQQHYWLAGGR